MMSSISLSLGGLIEHSDVSLWVGRLQLCWEQLKPQQAVGRRKMVTE